MIMWSVLISYCVCRRPSWKPKTQPNGCSAVVWLSFWFSTRFTRKTLDHSGRSYLYLCLNSYEDCDVSRWLRTWQISTIYGWLGFFAKTHSGPPKELKYIWFFEKNSGGGVFIHPSDVRLANIKTPPQLCQITFLTGESSFNRHE